MFSSHILATIIVISMQYQSHDNQNKFSHFYRDGLLFLETKVQTQEGRGDSEKNCGCVYFSDSSTS